MAEIWSIAVVVDPQFPIKLPIQEKGKWLLFTDEVPYLGTNKGDALIGIGNLNVIETSIQNILKLLSSKTKGSEIILTFTKQTSLKNQEIASLTQAS